MSVDHHSISTLPSIYTAWGSRQSFFFAIAPAFTEPSALASPASASSVASASSAAEVNLQILLSRHSLASSTCASTAIIAPPSRPLSSPTSIATVEPPSGGNCNTIKSWVSHICRVVAFHCTGRGNLDLRQLGHSEWIAV